VTSTTTTPSAADPREWDHLQWFQQIVRAVAAEYGVRLQPNARTTWSVSAELRTSILNAAGENG
jgi:hypothetical protein